MGLTDKRWPRLHRNSKSPQIARAAELPRPREERKVHSRVHKIQLVLWAILEQGGLMGVSRNGKMPINPIFCKKKNTILKAKKKNNLLKPQPEKNSGRRCSEKVAGRIRGVGRNKNKKTHADPRSAGEEWCCTKLQLPRSTQQV
jgi:hypothetical protein